MWLKFRKRITVFPWFTLNISKSWVSSTVWVKGFSVNFNKHGQYLNVGIPGTWIYDRIKIWWKEIWHVDFNGANNTDFNKELAHEIKSLDVWKMSDEIWEQIKQDIKNSFKQRKVLKKEISVIEIKIFFFMLILLVWGFLHKWFSKYYSESKWMLKELKWVEKDSYVKLDVNFDKGSKEIYDELIESFKQLVTCDKIWDITSAQDNDWVKDRSWASKVLKRKQTNICFDSLDEIQVGWEVLKFVNKNGGDIFLYPSHVVITNNRKIDIFDIRKLEISHFPDRMIEEEKVPKDTRIIDYTWRYVNKNGWPDKRYSNNKKIPVVEYGKLCFDSETWLYEEFVFSDSIKLDRFWDNLEIYLRYLNGENVKTTQKASNLDEEMLIDCSDCWLCIWSFSYNYLMEKWEVYCENCKDTMEVNISLK